MTNRITRAVIGALTAFTFSQAACATVLFSNDFGGGIGANETLSGAFTVADGYLGHHATYGDNEHSNYTLSLDLTGVSDAMLDLDFSIDSERNFDPLNVLVNMTQLYQLSGQDGGHLHLALGTQGLATIALNFASDFAITGRGVQIDNLAISGTVPSAPATPVSPVPEPASWALMVVGFGVLGGALRGQRTPRPHAA